MIWLKIAAPQLKMLKTAHCGPGNYLKIEYLSPENIFQGAESVWSSLVPLNCLTMGSEQNTGAKGHFRPKMHDLGP